MTVAWPYVLLILYSSKISNLMPSTSDIYSTCGFTMASTTEEEIIQSDWAVTSRYPWTSSCRIRPNKPLKAMASIMETAH